jgi:hypothetical protein
MVLGAGVRPVAEDEMAWPEADNADFAAALAAERLACHPQTSGCQQSGMAVHAMNTMPMRATIARA